MDSTEINLQELFKQLGLKDSDDAIESFIELHAPLPGAIKLANADFWDDGQSAFLREAIELDAEWAIVVGQLDSLLR